MAASTVTQRRPPEEGNPRARAVVGRIAELDPARAPEDGRLEAIVLGVVDAVAEGDEQTLRAALEALRDARGRLVGNGGGPEPGREHLLGWLAAATSFAHWALERVTAESPADGIATGTQAADFLTALQGRTQVGSSELRELLETDETQVSRTGRRLLESGLVIRRKVGRNVLWRLSPRGQRALELTAKPAAASSGRSFWREAMRRAFEGAGGDEPDPTRERIVESTLHLHTEKGVLGTTWEDIAALAGLPVDTVESYFPTQDDLVQACGQHVFGKLRLPPPERAFEVFAGAASEPERVRRLVDTLFGAYERVGSDFDAARRERADVPLVDDAISEIEESTAALVAEALGERAGDRTWSVSIQALTDAAVWRALRARGATQEESVEEASLAVEHWLAARG